MASKETWLSYFQLLEKLAETLGELAEIENNKAAAVIKGDLTTIDAIMKQEQAYALALRGYEQKRMSLLATLQVPPSTLSELHLYMPKELLQQGNEIVDRVKKKYARYKEAADLALGYLEAGLKQMETYTGEKSDYKPRASKDMPKKEREVGKEPAGKVTVPDLLEDRVLNSREVLATRIRTSENVPPSTRPMGSGLSVGTATGVQQASPTSKMEVLIEEEPVVRGVPDAAGSVRARVGSLPSGKITTSSASKSVREQLVEAAKQTALEEKRREKEAARAVATGARESKTGVPSREELMARVEAAAKAKVGQDQSLEAKKEIKTEKVAPPVPKKPLTPEEQALADEKKAIEDEKKAIEAQRKATEQAKKLIEQRKKAIEQEKKAAEQARKKAEDMKKAEEARLTREVARKEAEEVRRVQREEKKAADLEKKALKQEKRALEQEKRAIEHEKKALEQQRKALEQEKKALEQEELSLEELEEGGAVASDVAHLEASLAPVKEKGKSLLSQFMKKKKSKLEEESKAKESVESEEENGEEMDATTLGRLQQPASGKVPPSKEQLKKQKASENETPNTRNSSFKG